MKYLEHLPLVILSLFFIILTMVFVVGYLEINRVNFMKVKITAYCPGACCNEQWAGLLADGSKMSDVKHPVIAADWQVLSYKTKIRYNGVVYEVRDVGGLIKGRHIDILLPTHKEANEFGVKKNQIIEVLR